MASSAPQNVLVPVSIARPPPRPSHQNRRRRRLSLLHDNDNSNDQDSEGRELVLLSPKKKSRCDWNDDDEATCSQEPQRSSTVDAQESEEEDADSDSDACSLAHVSLLSPREQTKEYWIWCYGRNETQTNQALTTNATGFSASRAPPIKSCLSSSSLSFSRQQTAPHTPMSPQPSHADPFSTPTKSPRPPARVRTHTADNTRSVQFGRTVAVEYHKADPARRILETPPVEIIQTLPSPESPTEEDVRLKEETMHNTSILDEWEASFDEFLQHEEEEQHQPTSRRRSRGSKRRSSRLFTSPLQKDTKRTLNDDMDSAAADELVTPVQSSPSIATENEEDDPAATWIEGMAHLRVESPSFAKPPKDEEATTSLTGNKGPVDAAMDMDSSTDSSQTMDAAETLEEQPSPLPSKTAHMELSPCSTDTETSDATLVRSSQEDSTGKLCSPQGSDLSAIEAFPSSIVNPDDNARLLSPPPSSRNGTKGVTSPHDSFVDSKERDPTTTTTATVVDLWELLLTGTTPTEWDTTTLLVNLARHSHLFRLQQHKEGEEWWSSLVWTEALENCVSAFLDQIAATTVEDCDKDWLEWELVLFESMISCMESLEQEVTIHHKQLETLCQEQQQRQDNSLTLAQRIAVEEASVRQLEEQISETTDLFKVQTNLQRRIQDELSLWNHAFSCMTCEATSHLWPTSVLQWDDVKLEMSHAHVVPGLETQLVWDFSLDKLSLHLIGKEVSEDHPVARFLIRRLEAWIRRSVNLSLDDCLSVASVWLGRLDLATLELQNLLKEYSDSSGWEDDGETVVLGAFRIRTDSDVPDRIRVWKEDAVVPDFHRFRDLVDLEPVPNKATNVELDGGVEGC